MKSDWFDDVARAFVRANARKQSRRELLRATGAGGMATALGTLDGIAAPNRTAAIRAHNQAAAVDPIIDETAFNLEYDVDKIFEFVRDEVMYHPYAGVLRGAKGTLWGLAGSAADQAVLLAVLLNASLIKTRFAIGELSDQAEQWLVESLRTDAQVVRGWSERVFSPIVPEGESEPDALTADEEALLAGLTKAQERFGEIVNRQFGEGIETVLGALASAGISLPEPEVTLPNGERTQHVWVQFSSGTEWIDLDPSIPNSEPATTFATTTETIDQLPEDLFHRISMRLVAEKVVGGVPAREELLAFEATSAALVGVPITLIHPDAAALKAAGVAIQAVIGGYRNFIPALVVGNQSISGRPVTFLTGEGALGAFGDVMTEGDTLAEWLEIDIKTPGGERRIVRELFDRVGLARRGGDPIDLTAIPAIEFVDTEGGLPSFPPLAATWSIGVISGAVPWAYFDVDVAIEDPLVALSRAVSVYHHTRDVLALQATGLNGHRFFPDEPNVTTIIHTQSGTTAQEQTSTLLMDLLHRHLIAVPIDGVATGAQPQVAAGVFGHAVERALIETTGVELLGLPSEDFISVGWVFEEAKRQGISTVVLQSSADDSSRLAIEDEARIRVEAALADGYVVIVPERAVSFGGRQRTGWWLVDPGSGATLDQLDDGRGTTMVDYAFTLARVFICAAAAIHALGLISLINTYGAGNQLQERWIQNQVKKVSIAGGLCVGSFAV